MASAAYDMRLATGFAASMGPHMQHQAQMPTSYVPALSEKFPGRPTARNKGTLRRLHFERMPFPHAACSRESQQDGAASTVFSFVVVQKVFHKPVARHHLARWPGGSPYFGFAQPRDELLGCCH